MQIQVISIIYFQGYAVGGVQILWLNFTVNFMSSIIIMWQVCYLHTHDNRSADKFLKSQRQLYPTNAQY